jgi:hypothetical protein
MRSVGHDRIGPVAWLLVGLFVPEGCAGNDEVPPDSGDAGDRVETDNGDGSADETAESWTPEPPAPPAAIVLTPCPNGWREVSGVESGDPATCEPWPDGGPADCPADQAHFPGEPGCSTIGTPCSPADDWATDLPTGRTVLYIRPGAAPGGTGTRIAPFATLAEARAAAFPGAVLALAKGRYDEELWVPRDVTVWGACVAETVLYRTTPSGSAGAVSAGATGSIVRNLSVGGARVGVRIDPGRSLTLEDVLVADAETTGVLVTGEAARLAAHSLVVRDTRAQAATGVFGRGLNVEFGAQADISRAVVERNSEFGLVVTDPNSSVVLADVAIRDTREQPADGQGGAGIGVRLSGRVEASRTVLTGNRLASIYAQGTGTTIVLADVVVRDTQPIADGTHGYAIYGETGALLEADRLLLDENTNAAVFAFDPTTRLTITNAVIRNTRSRPGDGANGVGVTLMEGVAVSLSHVLLDGNRMAGLFVPGTGTTLTLEDAVIRDTHGMESSGVLGYGLVVQTGGTAVLRRVLFDRNRGSSLFVSDPGTSLVAEDLQIVETLVLDCATTTCRDTSAGTGVTSLGGARVELTRFVVQGSPLCGLQLAYGVNDSGLPWPTGGEMDLHQGVVSHNLIGVNVQTEGFDLTRLMDAVTFEDNVRNMDGETLPAPEPGRW